MKWEKIQKNEKKIILGISLLFIICMVIGVSYAYIAYTTKQEGINIIETDCINVEMEELTNALELRNAYPITDEEGSNSKPYRFKLTNTCGVGVEYGLHLEVLESERRIDSSNIAVKIDENEKKILTENPKIEIINYGVEGYEVGRNKLRAGESVIHDVRMWLDESAGNETQNGSFQSKIVIQAVQNYVVDIYTESLLNGADPVFANNLIPVEIDQNGNVTKADLTSEWYSYANKRWANAVLLENESINYQVGDNIPEENIESYFVWIPKYAYKIQTLGASSSGQESAFDIQFGIRDTKDERNGECTTASMSGSSESCQVGDYMTHPAFLAFGTNGIWVGKFEAGNSNNKMVIKPNQFIYSNMTISDDFKIAKDYRLDLDSHMMKNTEWGAVSYLTHSIYGRCTESACEEVMINNNGNFITGYASINPPTSTNSNAEVVSAGNDGNNSVNYFNPLSVKASTTGNYTGIYDMSGGTSEYVMGVLQTSPTDSTPLYSRSGFTTETFPKEIKYYDSYKYPDIVGKILGDATVEMNSWYQKPAQFLSTSLPWFYRGGDCASGTNAGISRFSPDYGSPDQSLGFRVVLAIL